jgi:5-methyltetrahydrofolate--homocysteine methyltransferase
MTAVDEMQLAVRAARQAGARVVGASFSFDRTRTGAARTMMGVDPSTAARAAVDAGADLVGCNCGAGFSPADLAPVVAALADHSGLPVLVEPNAGAPDPDTGAHALPPDAFARDARALLAAGARLVGGCCGTTPAHLRAVADALGS